MLPGDADSNPALVVATRGSGPGTNHRESLHRGAIVVRDAAGDTVFSCGNAGQPVFPRSAIKPLQALALVETGAADRFAVSAAELALACASHSGEPDHVAQVGAWLDRMGASPAMLECGAHEPQDAAAARVMHEDRQRPTALHNNCSGKHAGMIATALHTGAPVAGYTGYDHPVQRRLRDILGEVGDVDLSTAPWGVDGCSIPTIAMPLEAVALAMARFADPAGLGVARAAACRRIAAAMAAWPWNVAGSGCFCTRVMQATGGAVLVKTGAEGVYCGAVPGRGLGIALKIDDGATRAAEVACAAVLQRLGALDDVDREIVRDLLSPAIVSRRGKAVGAIRFVGDLPG